MNGSYRNQERTAGSRRYSQPTHGGAGYGDELEHVKKFDTVHGDVVDITDDGVIVSINGARFEGRVSSYELNQLPRELQESLQQEGFSHDFFVRGFERGTPGRSESEPQYYELTITDLWREEDWKLAENAIRSGETFTTTPFRYNKGGLLVHFGKKLEGFVPISHIWDFPSFREPEERERALSEWADRGAELVVKVIEVNREKRKLVLSNKEAEKERNRESQEAKFKALAVGDVLDGTVRNIREFGAFVDIGGGVEGLLHISEIDWDLVKHPRDYLTEGEVLPVKILQIDHAKGRIKLSRKALKETPWKSVPDRYKVGQVVWVDITRKKDFGAFAKLEPGVEGLIHVSEVAPKSESQPLSTIQEGDRVEVEIIRIDAANHRIGLSRAKVLENAPWNAPADMYEGDDYNDFDDDYDY